MEYFTTEDGLRLAYLDEGPRDGLPVLCLPGLSRNYAEFDFVAPHLADIRLIRLTLRGRDPSDRAPDASTYSVQVEARDVLGLLDHLGLMRVAILGSSRGGLIAMVLALAAPDRLIGACLNDVGPVVERAGLETIGTYLGRRPKFASREEFAHAKPKLMKGFSNVPHQRWLDVVRDQTVIGPDGRLDLPYDPALREGFVAALGQETPPLWPFFDALAQKPLAVIRGDGSELLSHETFMEMRRRAPAMIAAEIPDRGHNPFMDEPESLAVIRQWIEECSRIWP